MHQANSLAHLIELLSKIEDFRIERRKCYRLEEIIFLCISGVISGCETWDELEDFGLEKLDWLREYLPYSYGTPSHDTINRVMSGLDYQAFQGCFIDWVACLSVLPVGSLVAIDGKTICGSVDRSHGKRAIHLVNAWCSEVNLCLGQFKTEEKSNEITAIPALLDLLELQGCVVSIDAMGCQSDIAEKIITKGAHYLLAVKENQPDLYQEVVFLIEKNAQADEDVSWEKDHGRIEKREAKVVAISDFFGSEKWPEVRSIIRIRSEREILGTGKKEADTRYYISSIQATAHQFNQLVRRHWTVENQLHWTLDVLLGEDSSRKRQKNAATNFALIRKIALNLLKQESSTSSLNRKMKKAAISDSFRKKVLRI